MQEKLKYLLAVLFFLPFGMKAQKFVLQDSLKINIPKDCVFLRADIFNNLYFKSLEENTLFKYNSAEKKSVALKNFTDNQKLFVVNPFFLVVLDKISRTLKFYDDKFVRTQDDVPLPHGDFININSIFVKDNSLLWYFAQGFVQFNYRTQTAISYTNSISGLIENLDVEDSYNYKKNNYLLLKNRQDSLGSRQILRLSPDGTISERKIQQLKQYFFGNNIFSWTDADTIYFYNFENEEIKKAELPQKDGGYYFFNQQLFLWQPQVMYLYTLEN
ncbi:MAG: hypothetical protein LBT29_04840 [Flavobacteriaceae bacterium]|jgi:hypothetical protein|nr:hypothetical protein [Flavobacteriaceae bacterium]